MRTRLSSMTQSCPSTRRQRVGGTRDGPARHARSSLARPEERLRCGFVCRPDGGLRNAGSSVRRASGRRASRPGARSQSQQAARRCGRSSFCRHGRRPAHAAPPQPRSPAIARLSQPTDARCGLSSHLNKTLALERSGFDLLTRRPWLKEVFVWCTGLAQGAPIGRSAPGRRRPACARAPAAAARNVRIDRHAGLRGRARGTFDQQASSYDQKWSRLAAFRDALHLLIGSVIRDLPANARVLCVGAGTGAVFQAGLIRAWYARRQANTTHRP
jgi:hypothetical protein